MKHAKSDKNKKRTSSSVICPVPLEENEIRKKKNQTKKTLGDLSFAFYHSINAELLSNKIFCDLIKQYSVLHKNVSSSR